MKSTPIATIKSHKDVDPRKVNEVVKVFEQIGLINVDKETKHYELENLEQFFHQLDLDLLKL